MRNIKIEVYERLGKMVLEINDEKSYIIPKKDQFKIKEFLTKRTNFEMYFSLFGYSRYELFKEYYAELIHTFNFESYSLLTTTLSEYLHS